MDRAYGQGPMRGVDGVYEQGTGQGRTGTGRGFVTRSGEG